MIPRFISQGIGINIRSNSTGLVTWPSDVSVSDYAILMMATNNSGTTLTFGSVINWTTLVPNTAILNNTGRLQILYRTCAGTEDGLNNITVIATASAGRSSAQVYLFRGTSGGVLKFDANNGAGFNSISNALATQQTGLGVSVSGANRLLMNLWSTAQNLTSLTVTSETGALWQPTEIFTGAGGPGLYLNYASLTDSGSITGGSTNVLSAATSCFIVGTGMWESLGIQPLIISPTGASFSGGGGDTGTVVPIGF